MSTEEIIHTWKNGPLGKNLAQVPHSVEKPEDEPSETPTNPIGEQELSDEELELVEGGKVESPLCGSPNCTLA